MPYSNSIGDNGRLLRRTLTGVTDFSGRSCRTEVVYYWIASALTGVVLTFAASAVAPLETSLILGVVLRLVLAVPTFAQFVRRLHDQDKSGWWGLLLPLCMLLTIPEIVVQARGDVAEFGVQQTTPTGIAATLFGLAVFVLCLWPGTEGTNRYGPDPRLEDV